MTFLLALLWQWLPYSAEVFVAFKTVPHKAMALELAPIVSMHQEIE